ncbi:MAG: hypothetical protein CL583_09985 [Alteromonadaceae bacterium]|nr:hypothetical protein [Alteromonadaceae bacterium]|tara:strand:- start:432 stop:1130 length:699 start_codon:yes stop_codon:yes gene_type:complete
MAEKNLTPRSKKVDIDQFIEQAARLPGVNQNQGRLLFALDATASRQPSWDRACQFQSEMFLATRQMGGLAVKLCYYRGFNEFKATAWLDNTDNLLKAMNQVTCIGGHTQIRRVLKQALADTRDHPVKAVVFIGDCCEEAVDDLCQLAGELGLMRTPVFAFQDGHEPHAEAVFRQISKLSGGAYARLDADASEVLRELLSAVAVYASGGAEALKKLAGSNSEPVRRLTRQLRP